MSTYRHLTTVIPLCSPHKQWSITCHSLVVMVVMGLWGCQERKVIATVRQCGGQMSQNPVHPGRGQVSTNQSRPQDVAPQVDCGLFHRVAVEGGHGARGSPVMVHLVDVLEEERVMKKSEGEGRGGEWVCLKKENFRWLFSTQFCFFLNSP